MSYVLVRLSSAIVHQMQRSQVLPGYPYNSAGAHGRGSASISNVVRPLQIITRACGGGKVYNRQCAAVKTTQCEIKMQLYRKHFDLQRINTIQNWGGVPT